MPTRPRVRTEQEIAAQLGRLMDEYGHTSGYASVGRTVTEPLEYRTTTTTWGADNIYATFGTRLPEDEAANFNQTTHRWNTSTFPAPSESLTVEMMNRYMVDIAGQQERIFNRIFQQGHWDAAPASVHGVIWDELTNSAPRVAKKKAQDPFKGYYG